MLRVEERFPNNQRVGVVCQVVCLLIVHCGASSVTQLRLVFLTNESLVWEHRAELADSLALLDLVSSDVVLRLKAWVGGRMRVTTAEAIVATRVT